MPDFQDFGEFEILQDYLRFFERHMRRKTRALCRLHANGKLSKQAGCQHPGCELNEDLIHLEAPDASR